MADLLYETSDDGLIVFNQEIFKLFRNLRSVIICCGEYSTDYEIDMYSIYPLFEIFRNIKIILKAHNPSWLCKRFAATDSKDMNVKIVLESTIDYYGKKEDCVTISS